MKYTLRYSTEALYDLDRVWMDVLEASQELDIADRYIDDLRARVRKMDLFPRSGSPLTFMGEFTGIYMVFFKAYIAFYRINENFIEVGRVLYAGSDYAKTLFGRSEYILEDAEE